MNSSQCFCATAASFLLLFFFKYLLILFLQVVLVSDGTPQVMQPTAFQKGMSFVARSVISADLVGKGSTLHVVQKMGKDLPSH